MDVESLLKEQQRLNRQVEWLDNVIRTYIDSRKNEMGLVLDEVKTPAYVALKRERQQAWNQFREFNGKYAKKLHGINRLKEQ